MAGFSDAVKTIQYAGELAGSAASELLDKLADTIRGEADTLRDGTELYPVELPRDLFAHEHAQTEWWYYTGHIESRSHRRFGFELVFFKRRTDLDRFGIVPLRLLGNPIYFAHFALTDTSEKKFRYAHRKSGNGLFDYPAAASSSHFYLRLGEWSVRESHGCHVLQATMNGDVSLEARLKPVKNPILNGELKNGVSLKDEGQASRYFSFTRMEVEGELTIEGRTEHVSGSAWMDREFGTWTATDKQKGWDWFSIQMSNGTELMIYQLRDGEDKVSEYSSGVFVSEDGRQTYLARDQVSVTPVGYWKSSRSGTTYPSGWKVNVPSLAISLAVDPVMEEQELDTRGTTMIVYWEGACHVSGSFGGSEVGGNAYIELVGYDRSHENPNLAHFLMGDHFESE